MPASTKIISAVDLYRTMYTIKECDDQFWTLMQSGQVVLNYYSPRGQEAVATGICAALDSTDYLVTTYRGLHDHLAKGVPLSDLWAEFLGRATGTCKGKGGPMHITHPDSGLMVTTGVVGSGLPIANGFALWSQINGDGRVTACSFGDGASNIGAFHEALNLASVWKLPVIFVCHNNLYAEHTALAAGTGVTRIADRAASYGMVGVQVDGNDPLAVRDAAAEAVARARAGEGPTLIEAVTFRFRGHQFGDPGEYIDKAEMAAARERDPLPRLRARLLDEFGASPDELTALEDEVRAAVTQAAKDALATPEPSVEELFTDVFATTAGGAA
ncbi:acetoin dehydrogenase E1 component (TPP-dependent alpha subunit) [Frankia canadensis]|uniref:Acetoin dehydrogenase E1 component (TPP-dependent alpha subunit) n=1 Tax=Frankia canadensis TaxID=1836972 RepID=A0A2I2KJG1_9ACTN|nr:thiamine pyrophosphate-dependent dehydrogenase E1 component subunit alpha [Frankia canadensis]SNQ45803.1 acetoin dehydrogenase E1 component (TPP-dependent alpha subunit) [Frankia canadensis]SOU53093.1 acetoin dehydrogenase E1 component (TPP-dependent alpha subunit) [Frankia canadensis]